ncbi:MAG: 50S ribosomal protein L35 [Candidatus Omnitrophota bacterium]
MPKQKTNKSVAKRFSLTKKGKLKRARACKSHLLSTKSRKRKRMLRQGDYVSKIDEKRIKRLLGNLK